MRAAKYSVVVPAQAGTHTPCIISITKPESFVTFASLVVAKTGFMGPRLRGDDNRGYTPKLSINLVLPILAATSSRIGPSLRAAIGASVKAWRASR